MTASCTHLDHFFDGELTGNDAAAFRVHLADCERCQTVLRGRMLEDVTVHEASAPLDQLARRRRTTAAVIGASAMTIAAAAAILLWMHVPTPRNELSLTWSVASIAGSRASSGGASPPSMSLGQVLVAHVSLPGATGAIWLYREGSALVAACPGHACRADSESGVIIAEFRPTTIGSYELIAASGATLPAPPATSIDAIATLRGAGIHFQIETIRVR
jgi:hypothetical protein